MLNTYHRDTEAQRKPLGIVDFRFGIFQHLGRCPGAQKLEISNPESQISSVSLW